MPTHNRSTNASERSVGEVLRSHKHSVALGEAVEAGPSEDLVRLVRLREKRRTQGVASLNYADNLWLIQAERPLKPPGHPEARMACEEWT